MRTARGLVAGVALMAASAAVAQEETGLQAAGSAGLMFGQGSVMFGARAGVAFTLPDERFQIRYLAEFYGSGSQPYSVGGGCLATCPVSSANNQLVGMSVGSRFSPWSSNQAPYFLATLGVYQSRFSVYNAAVHEDPVLAASRQQYMTVGFAGGGGIGMNFDTGPVRLFGEVQVLYTSLYHGTNAPSFIVPVTVGIGF